MADPKPKYKKGDKVLIRNSTRITKGEIVQFLRVKPNGEILYVVKDRPEELEKYGEDDVKRFGLANPYQCLEEYITLDKPYYRNDKVKKLL